jgi:hypothetical protein
MTYNAVLMNDTRMLGHFGCQRVMRRIEELLAVRGIGVIGRSAVRAEWQQDAAFLAALAQSHVLVINGEGTMHHGAAQARRLLDVVEHPARGTTPVVLLNALYQDNPPEWGPLLDRISLIAARDSWSAAEISRVTATPVRHVDDLSMSAGFIDVPSRHRSQQVVIGDSVFPDVSSGLAAIARDCRDVALLPIQDRSLPVTPRADSPFAAWRRSIAHAVGVRETGPCRSETDYIDRLRCASLHLTGRFHAVCLSLVTRTPFLCLASNSWKIEALLHDFGLGTDRLVTPGQFAAAIKRPADFAFTVEEESAITRGVNRCREQSNRLFDDLVALAAASAGG